MKDGDSRDARRKARAAATFWISRPDEEAAAELEDVRYWEHIPLNERAEFVWKLSVEMYGLSVTSRSVLCR